MSDEKSDETGETKESAVAIKPTKRIQPEEEPLDPGTRPVFYAGGAVLLGVVGWLALQQAPASEAPPADEAAVEANAAAATDDAPKTVCDEWKDALCEKVGGGRAQACTQVTGAAALLSEDSCRRELEALPATVARINDARSGCNTLMDKLCGDLGEETSTCKMVRTRTPEFPVERCTEMLSKYDKVLADLKEMDKRVVPGMPAGGHAGHGHAPGAHHSPSGDTSPAVGTPTIKTAEPTKKDTPAAAAKAAPAQAPKATPAAAPKTQPAAAQPAAPNTKPAAPKPPVQAPKAAPPAPPKPATPPPAAAPTAG